jgi:multidomain signaling protein FimX
VRQKGEPIQLIVIEESDSDAEIILNQLRKARYPIRPQYCDDDERLQDLLAEHEWDLILSVPEVDDFTITEVCELVSSSKQDIPVIGLDDKLDSKKMVQWLKAGVKQIIPKDNSGCLPIAVGRELENLAQRRELKRLQQLYKESQKHNKILLESSQDAIAYVQDGMHVHANPSYLNMFGYENMDDLEGLPIMDLIAVNDQPKFRDFMRTFMAGEKEEESQISLEGIKANKERLGLNMEFIDTMYDNERCIQVIIRDQLPQTSVDITCYDPITGLFNRQHFVEKLDNALVKAVESHTRNVLFYIALDNFHTIKDNVGIIGVDPVIENIGKVLSGFSEEGILARFDESTFTLLMTGKEGKKPAAAGELANKICKAIADSVTEIGEQSIIATCSIGIAQPQVFTSAGSPEDVLKAAHKACKHAQEQGGNRHEEYKPEKKKEEALSTSDWNMIIQTAIKNNRFSLRFQPIVSLRGEALEMYEVLLRMVDTDGQLVPTGELFDNAEKANLSVELDKWVLENAIKTLVEQEKKGHQNYFFLKLSDQAIRDESILLYIRKLLKASQLPGERIIIEISESIAIAQIKLASTFISQLKTFGCQSALEHFGTGLNSEMTLKHLSVDYVKIDSQFSKGLATNAENQEAVQKLVKLVHEMGKLAISEAVEDTNDMVVLWSSEVDFAQGHSISEPLEQPEFEFSEE